jgi:hypothetical protein
MDPKGEATKPTETLFVVSVAPVLASIQKTRGDSPAANDPKHSPKSLGELTPPADHKVSATHVIEPDRYCWPHSEAMIGREIDAFTSRLARFTNKGATPMAQAEQLADRLVKRDRDADDRRLCLECRHLSGHTPGAWRCQDWQRACTAIDARGASIPGDLVCTLQRCDGFTAAH